MLVKEVNMLAALAVAACVTVGSAMVCDTAECVVVNPYSNPDKATACMELLMRSYVPPKPPLRAFQIGVVYTGPYGYRMRVLGLAMASTGVQVVTCEWINTAPGEVFSFRNDDNWLSKLFWP
jgi:hypothetical protein